MLVATKESSSRSPELYHVGEESQRRLHRSRSRLRLEDKKFSKYTGVGKEEGIGDRAHAEGYEGINAHHPLISSYLVQNV